MSEKSLEIPEVLTKQQLQAVISEKLGNTLYWLSKAYNSRPGDDASERALLEIMAGLQSMQQNVNQVFSYGSKMIVENSQKDLKVLD